jgi:hypothetical protein
MLPPSVGSPMQANVKRGFNRLFVLLVPVWVAYCLIVYPMQQQIHAEKAEKAEFLQCWQASTPPDFKGCADYAEIKSGVNGWSLKAFYARESWALALVVVTVTLVVYGVCRGVAALGLWVWRGFKS